eukprot:COSAG01_NODE_5263_length_4376_cov_3.153612_2_plen_72_part_00
MRAAPVKETVVVGPHRIAASSTVIRLVAKAPRAPPPAAAAWLVAAADMQARTRLPPCDAVHHDRVATLESA